MKDQFKPWFQAISNCCVEPIKQTALKNTGAVFAFKFPVKFSMKGRFSQGDTDATATAYFYEGNLAKIVANAQEVNVTWLKAYDQIAKSSFGTRVLPLPVNITEAFSEFTHVNENIEEWMTKFNLIPCILASPGNSSEFAENSLAIACTVKIPDGLYEIMEIVRGEKIAGSSEASLTVGNTVNWLYYDTNKVEGTIDKYAKEYKSWDSFYKALQSYLKELHDQFKVMFSNVETTEGLLSSGEITARVMIFKNMITERFGHTGVMLNDHVNEEDGILFSVNFPMTLKSLQDRSDNEGVLEFTSTGMAFCRFSSTLDETEHLEKSELFQKTIEPIFDKYVPWDKAFKSLSKLLSKLTSFSEKLPQD